jgi:hypothetical protein
MGPHDREIRLAALKALLSGDSGRCRELLNAARLLFRALVDDEPGMQTVFCMMCLEAVLLDPLQAEEVMGRLSEAVAYRLGTFSARRADLRKRVKKLYGVRSAFVHTGELVGNDKLLALRPDCIELTKQVLAREILDLPRAGFNADGS